MASNGPAPNRSRPKIVVVIIFGGPKSFWEPGVDLRTPRRNFCQRPWHQDKWAPGQVGTRTSGYQDKWAPGQMGTGQMGTGQMGTGTNGHWDKWAPDKWAPNKWALEQMGTGQMGTGQMGTGQMSTGKLKIAVGCQLIFTKRKKRAQQLLHFRCSYMQLSEKLFPQHL